MANLTAAISWLCYSWQHFLAATGGRASAPSPWEEGAFLPNPVVLSLLSQVASPRRLLVSRAICRLSVLVSHSRARSLIPPAVILIRLSRRAHCGGEPIVVRRLLLPRLPIFLGSCGITTGHIAPRAAPVGALAAMVVVALRACTSARA